MTDNEEGAGECRGEESSADEVSARGEGGGSPKKQNKTKQHETKQNKTKQNKTKQTHKAAVLTSPVTREAGK